MSIDKAAIYQYVQKNFNIVFEQDKNNIYELLVLLGEIDDLYDQKSTNFNHQELNRIKAKMTSLIPDSSLKEKTLDSLFTAIEKEANYQQYDSLTTYLENSSITSGVPLIAGYLGTISQINSEIWFSQRVNSFGYEIGSIIRMANDYLDGTTSKNRYLAEASQRNSLLFFQNKLSLKLFIAYKYFLHKLRYYSESILLKYLDRNNNSELYLKAINCYESVLELGFKAYFRDEEACRD